MAKQQKTKRQKYSDISSTHPVLCPDGKYRWVRKPLPPIGTVGHHTRLPAAHGTLPRARLRGIFLRLLALRMEVQHPLHHGRARGGAQATARHGEQGTCHRQTDGTGGRSRRQFGDGRNGNTGCQPHVDVHKLQQRAATHTLPAATPHQSEGTLQP